MTLLNKSYFLTSICAILFSTSSIMAQEKIEKYIVEKGETVTQIAKKFNVTPYDIYKLNPDAQSGLKPNSVLLIPKAKAKNNDTALRTTAKSTSKTHVVLAKETLFGIEKKYNVTDEELKKANPDLVKYGLQIGQVLNIPSKGSAKKTTVVNNKPVFHTVLPKETKYSIAKQYGISIEELERKNPDIVSNLTVGYELLIKGQRPENKATSTDVETKKTDAKLSIAEIIESPTFVNYTIKSKETFYSLSKQFGLSQQELTVLNPILVNGVQEGMIIKVPTQSNQVVTNSVKQNVVLTKPSSNDKKTLVLLLPFNVEKMDPATSLTVDKLNEDKFLNMTLDFYSGAMMAIDSAKQIGVNVDVKVFDSNESKSTSNVSTIFNNTTLLNTDAVIGPFYQSNVEKTANILKENNVPVISPLSKDDANPIPNLYQSIISNSDLKTGMFNFLNAKQGNIIAVIDKKKETIRKYILENQKDVKIAPLTATGGVNIEGFKAQLVKDKMNYVILETANTAMIKYTIKAMLDVMATYQVQLVILESNDTLDTDDIYFENLTKLHLMYPSVTRENNSPEALLFMQSYRNKNKVNPSTFAIRGFDVTFDTLMRLSQGKSYQETAEMMVTEQIESKFDYQKNKEGNFVNNGFYILYYDTDLTVKEAK
ncbi:LysM peptidoglycan-binding domain-containing protein [Flavobacterium adhaerens]|uniref:LysM peptidoglycan-binding domain-containing protein n=1 Tax=Flavobacterium adhaerens TaxID=3149043 RepID=UPI0032B583C6